MLNKCLNNKKVFGDFYMSGSSSVLDFCYSRVGRNYSTSLSYSNRV